MIYLDHAAATPILPTVLKRLERDLAEHWVNSSSSHIYGKKEAKFLEELRKKLAEMIGAQKEQIFFCSSVTEANNLFFHQKHLPCCYFAGDHSSVVKSARSYDSHLELPFHFEKEFFLPMIQESIEGGSFLFCATNSQSGLLLDPIKITGRVRESVPHAFVGFDCSQYFGHFSIDVSKIDADFLSLSSHKIGGPKGIAACYVREPKKLMPMFQGGGHEFNLRSSTVSVAHISGFIEAATFWQQEREHLDQRYRDFRQLLYEGLEEMSIFPFQDKLTTPHITFLIAPGVSSDILMRHLEMDEVIVSATSACSSKVSGHSEIFASLGIEDKFHKNILRISFGPSTTQEEVELFIQSYKKHYSSLCRLKGRK